MQAVPVLLGHPATRGIWHDCWGPYEGDLYEQLSDSHQEPAASAAITPYLIEGDMKEEFFNGMETPINTIDNVPVLRHPYDQQISEEC